MKRILLTIATVSLFALSAQARDSSDGCGLGWEITQKTTFSATTTRGTTNVFVPPTFGMTTGTLGCSRHGLVKKQDEAAAVYAVENYDSLRQEMAEGQGENLRAFASLLGCGHSSYENFARMTKSHFSSIAKDSGSRLDLFLNVRAEMNQDALLAASCNAG